MCFLGLGFGLIYFFVVVIVGYYFEKRCVIVIGIVVCGFGVGIFIFVFVNVIMMDVFDWRNLVMIQVGIVLNVCVFGMLMRLLELIKKMK